MKKYIRNQCTIDNAQLTMIAALIMLTSLLACTADSDSELSTSTSLAITVTPPPAWQAGVDTRHTITDGKATWANSDILHGTITFHHKSGLVDEPVPFELNLGTSKFVETNISAPTWPVGQDIAHATLQGLYGYTDANATTRLTDADGINLPIYHATAKAKPGEALNISFTHRTAAVYIKNTNTAAITFKVGELTAITVSSNANATLYPIIAADAKEITGTVTLSDGTILPFAIAAGKEGLLGKIHTVADGATPGSTDPGTERKLIQKATDDFVAWAQAYNKGTEKKDYKLTYHVDLSLSTELTDGLWAPIGSSNAFAHIFDGAGYTIRGLKITGTADGQGLFGYTDGATIANVTIVNPVVTNTAEKTGALVGNAFYTTISHCGVEGGSVTGGTEEHTGGLAGNAEESYIVNCYANTTVIGGKSVGGLIGAADLRGSIVACHSAGSVTATTSETYVGGLVGYDGVTTTFCYTTATVHASATTGTPRAGGLVGWLSDEGNTTSCYATGNVAVAGITTYTGSLVGRNVGGISYCCASGTATGNKLIGKGTNDGTNGAYQAAPLTSILRNDAVPSITVRMYNTTTKQVETVTITKDIWQNDLTLDLSTGIQP